MNHLVKLMIKRGLVSDLARVPHSLDLSNPSTVATVNSLLRPLETLSRIVNQPQLAHSSGRPGGNNSSQQAASSNSNTGAAVNNANNATSGGNSNTNEQQQQSGEATHAPTRGQGEDPSNRSGNGTSRPTLSQQSSQQDEEVLEDMEDMDVMDEDSMFQFQTNELNESDLGPAENRLLTVDVNISLPDGDDGDDESQDGDDDDGEEMDEENLVEVTAQVEALEQALDEILSQGRSDHSVHDDDDPTDEDNNEEGGEAHADEGKKV